MILNGGVISLCVGLCLSATLNVFAESDMKKNPADYLSAVHPHRSIPGQFVQKDFVIGVFSDPPIDGDADQRYREMAKANFTVVIGQHRADSVEKRAKQLQLCEKYGLKAILLRSR
jgi:hypothetical protein